MSTWKITSCLLLTLLPLGGSAAPSPAGTLQIAGAVVTPVNWSVNGLRQQYGAGLQPIPYLRRGVTHTAHAVSLRTVLQSAQPGVNPQIKNHALQFVALVRGHDGYTAAFSLPELPPDFGHENVVKIAVVEEAQAGTAGMA